MPVFSWTARQGSGQQDGQNVSDPAMARHSTLPCGAGGGSPVLGKPSMVRGTGSNSPGSGQFGLIDCDTHSDGSTSDVGRSDTAVHTTMSAAQSRRLSQWSARARQTPRSRMRRRASSTARRPSWGSVCQSEACQSDASGDIETSNHSLRSVRVPGILPGRGRAPRVLGAGARRRSMSADLPSERDRELARACHSGAANVGLFNLGLRMIPSIMWTRISSTVTTLDLRGNQLSSLGEAVGQLTRLIALDVSSNQLRALPACLGKLTNLAQLAAQHNHIESVPDTFASSNLEEVNLAWNALPSFPLPLASSRFLRRLDIAENERIHTLPGEVARLPTGCSVRLDNDPDLVAAAAALTAAGAKCSFEWSICFPSQIRPFLYVGALRSVQDRVFQRLGVTHVLTTAAELDQVKPPPPIAHLRLAVADEDWQDMKPTWAEAHRFIDNARTSGGVCLVHCFKGQSRSVSTVVSYLIAKEGMTTESAIACVRAARPCARPNDGFLRQLNELQQQATAATQRHHDPAAPAPD
eukprot:TRINITY_DN1546_c0_g1_i1.p1 TRINITY_DN1546_c0_g1~~TRINITY_DN1546_c0_g1_i1.p1  ORF type:complete len:550 (+),score=122.42 TRINITY_DN1546_c0_g1_i1:77-1651(+)